MRDVIGQSILIQGVENGLDKSLVLPCNRVRHFVRRCIPHGVVIGGNRENLKQCALVQSHQKGDFIVNLYCLFVEIVLVATVELIDIRTDDVSSHVFLEEG